MWQSLLGVMVVELLGGEAFASTAPVPVFTFGKTSAKALLKHIWTLESFTLVPGFRFLCKDIHQLLCSALRLKKLNLVGILQKRGPNVDGSLDARDIVTSDKMCNTLEIFRCQIGQIHARISQGRSPNGQQASL